MCLMRIILLKTFLFELKGRIYFNCYLYHQQTLRLKELRKIKTLFSLFAKYSVRSEINRNTICLIITCFMLFFLKSISDLNEVKRTVSNFKSKKKTFINVPSRIFNKENIVICHMLLCLK